MFGISMDKVILLLVVAVVLLGPERLPRLAVQASAVVRRFRAMAQITTEQVRRDLGVDELDVDWRSLDPRQLDPRRLIRDALLADPPLREEEGAPELQPSGSTTDAATSDVRDGMREPVLASDPPSAEADATPSTIATQDPAA